MNEMLDILSQNSTSDSILEEVGKHRFEDKLAVADQLFPENLIREGCPNAFTPLYQLTSEAIHRLSEEESVVLFDECRLVFEYVFSQLRPHLKKQREFRSGLQNLAKRAGRWARD